MRRHRMEQEKEKEKQLDCLGVSEAITLLAENFFFRLWLLRLLRRCRTLDILLLLFKKLYS